MKKRILILLFILAGAAQLSAQQDPMYSMYMFNQLVLNPAYAGSREMLSATAISRRQWTGIFAHGSFAGRFALRQTPIEFVTAAYS